MKFISETKALAQLQGIKDAFAETIRDRYEFRAKSCVTCETPGACCLDADFVNVQITRLEANAIKLRLHELPDAIQQRVAERIGHTIEKYGLYETNDVSTTYACPLFEKGIGCLAHESGKPLPCIADACYENKEDLPPDELLTEREIEVENSNERAYGKSTAWLPLPIAIKDLRKI